MRVFNETQKFTQWWLQSINIGLVVFLLYSFYKWFIANQPVGNVAANDLTGKVIVVCATIPVLLLLYFMKMETKIEEIEIHYRFLPFHFSKKTIRWGDMRECYVRKYNAIVEYGGWGLRGSFGKSKAYNVKGNIGIQTVLKNNEKILIGTQRGKNATEVIKRYLKNSHERI